MAAVMDQRWIELRYRGRCSRCRAGLGVGELARFDTRTREISCPDCDERARTARLAAIRHAPPYLLRPSQDERARAKAMIADARARLAAARQAS